MTTAGQPVTDWHDSQCDGDPCDCLIPGLVAAKVAEAHAAGLAQGRAEGLDVERHREAVSRSLRQFGKHPWWPPTIDLSDTILTEYAALAETPVEPDAPDPIETFGHPYRAPVVIDGHQYVHTSDCEWPTTPVEAGR